MVLTAKSKLCRKKHADEQPDTERCWWVFKRTWADCVPVTARCAEEFRLTCICVIVTNLLCPYCVPRGTGGRNVWKPHNQSQDPRRKCLADGKHRWSCCVYSFGNKGCHPEIHDIKEPPECLARRDIKVVKGITCTPFTLMGMIKSIIAFQKKNERR